MDFALKTLLILIICTFFSHRLIKVLPARTTWYDFETFQIGSLLRRIAGLDRSLDVVFLLIWILWKMHLVYHNSANT